MTRVPLSPSNLSPTITTRRLQETRAFYERHFGAQAVFDCGWYVQLKLSSDVEVCLMAPQEDAQTYQGGVTLNLRVDDVDVAHAVLRRAAVPIVIPLEDHPWGDRGFGVADPSGVVVYCFKPIAPSAEFAPFFKEAQT
jgi:uncharacterized glyoxalase superfamily protein PhnB